MRTNTLSATLALLGGVSSLLSAKENVAKKDPRPNIILILVDDLGFSDIGSYGSEIQTPNLDRLASEGVRLQQFYNNSISAPTRASLLTGQYQHKAGVGYFSVNLGLPAYQGYLNKESLTLGEVFRSGGYQTFLSGKWHVGADSLNHQRPNQRGFDRSFGFLGGASTYLYPDSKQNPRGVPGPLYEEGKPVSFQSDPHFYLTDAITDHAVKYIEESNRDKPFFLYLAYNAPHWPLQAKQKEIAKYKGVYDIGWDSIHSLRLAKQKELGLVNSNLIPAERNKFVPDWESLTYDEQKLWAKKMEVFAAMVDEVDQGIGKVLQTLQETGKYDNTLIVFISDNGAPAEDVSGRGRKAVNEGPVGTAGSYESQSKNWSYASNTPFREYKSFAYEGGISSPFIAWYPKQIEKGIKKGYGHIIDLAPTFYDIAGIRYPQTYDKIKVNPLPGISLKNVLFEQVEPEERLLFWERAGNRAVRKGSWKLVSIYPSYQWELYDIDTDRGETNDVAKQYPEIVNELSEAYFKWAKENEVVDFDKIRPKRALIPASGDKGIQVF